MLDLLPMLFWKGSKRGFYFFNDNDNELGGETKSQCFLVKVIFDAIFVKHLNIKNINIKHFF